MFSKIKRLVPQRIKNYYHLTKAIGANCRFGFPAKKIKVIGVTGTNGKTTTVQMVARILEEAGFKVAVFSTINTQIGSEVEVNKTKFTTTSAWNLQNFIKQAVDAKCDYLVLEVSSHALDQRRVWGIGFEVAAITNVTREHFDYHRNMEGYRKAKAKLFQRLNSRGAAVVNLEMEKPEEFLDQAQKSSKGGELWGYQAKKTPSEMQQEFPSLKIVKAQQISLKGAVSTFSCQNQNFNLNLPGRFNIENSLAAIALGLSQKIPLKKISQALARIKKVPGRMDRVENSRGLEIVIDYALTPDSMEKLGQLTAKMKEEASYPDRKIIWVFGSCGDRDRGKRPIMGEIVSRYADFAIVTNEDPYYEDPEQIMREVFEGVKRSGQKKPGQNAWKITDRKEALKKAIELGGRGDVILVTGKGAEEGMFVKGQIIPWNDRKVIERILET
jgi:UDP-N-acetylmuramoyl-L-alanyl-D-glutamate--2,6-diaminopimelate ligase